MCSVDGRPRENRNDGVERGLLYDLTTLILLAGSDLVTPWLLSIHWSVITLSKDFLLYVPVLFSSAMNIKMYHKILPDYTKQPVVF